MKVTALLAAVPTEAELIVRSLVYRKSIRAGNKSLWMGRLHGRDMVVMYSGIGMVNASHATTLLIERFSPELIINTGIAGAYEGTGPGVGDVALATAEIYGDCGVAGGDGYGSFRKIGLPLVENRSGKFYNEFSLDGPLVKDAMRFLRDDASADFNVNVVKGRFVTVAASSASGERAVQMARLHGAVCENMEGAAVAHICAIYGIDMIEVRGISNVAGIRDRRRWNIKRAATNCQKAVMKMLGAGIL
jgi:futalosine hydrolase